MVICRASELIIYDLLLFSFQLLLSLFVERDIHKTSHNESTMHVMLPKIWCGTVIDESGIIGRYRIIARKTRKFNDKYYLCFKDARVLFQDDIWP
jgi:hypothetical protein